MLCRNKNDKNVIMWFRSGVWKLRGLRTGVGKGRWFAYKGENEVKVKRRQDGGKNC
jgi:hypothetical protein